MSEPLGNINELATDLAAAQGEIMPAPKDADNPFFKSKYASLPAVREAMREAFAKHGLSVVQMPQIVDGKLQLRTVLLHSSGQYLDCGTLAADVDLSKPQAIGSAITYFRRYSLASISQTVADDDDDANAATTHKPTKPQRPPAKPQPPCTAEEVSNLHTQINDAATLDDLKTILAAAPYRYLKANGPQEDYEKISKLARSKHSILSQEVKQDATSDSQLSGRESTASPESRES